MVSDQAADYERNGFLLYTTRKTEEFSVTAGDTYLNQVYICCLILCAELCKPGVKSCFGQMPYHYDNINFEELHERISSSGIDCTRHFTKIEKLMTGRLNNVSQFVE